MFKRLFFLNMNVISSFLIAASAFGVKYDPQDRFIKKIINQTKEQLIMDLMILETTFPRHDKTSKWRNNWENTSHSKCVTE